MKGLKKSGSTSFGGAKGDGEFRNLPIQNGSRFIEALKMTSNTFSEPCQKRKMLNTGKKLSLSMNGSPVSSLFRSVTGFRIRGIRSLNHSTE
jgi:hypothetical protein